jgi:DNA-directed RNA polymerase specialized sigma24 family protein
MLSENQNDRSKRRPMPYWSQGRWWLGAWKGIGLIPEDVNEGAFWKACQHPPNFHERAAFSTWLTRIAVNEGVEFLRERRTAHLAESDTAA